MIGITVKSVGIAKATVIIGLINLTYILFRYEQVVRLNIVFFLRTLGSHRRTRK